jgi:hypothetical protein
MMSGFAHRYLNTYAYRCPDACFHTSAFESQKENFSFPLPGPWTCEEQDSWQLERVSQGSPLNQTTLQCAVKPILIKICHGNVLTLPNSIVC